MKNYILILFCICAALKGACQTVRNDSMEYSSVHLGKGDKIFLALKDTAQKHLQTFINGLKQHGKDFNKYRFVVKSDFVQNGDHEHMWSRVFMYKNGVFQGLFIDSAFTVKNIKAGDRVSIKKDKIEDWIISYVNSNQIISGGFSDKYLKSKKKRPKN